MAKIEMFTPSVRVPSDDQEGWPKERELEPVTEASAVCPMCGGVVEHASDHLIFGPAWECEQQS